MRRPREPLSPVARPLAVLAGRAAFVLLAALAISAVGCGKRAGGSCKPGESLCVDKDNALSCQAGKLVPVGCHGPLGCTRFGERASCDDSIAAPGDACIGLTEEEFACSADRRRALLCKAGRFAPHLECRGKGGCTLLGQQISCDTSVAARGDPCKVQGASACTEDQKELVVCRDGKFVAYRHCRGQYGCYTKGDAPACDETLSLEGDPCGLDGYVVCSVDKKSELVCQSGSFVRTRACKKGCVVQTRSIECN